MQPTDIIRDDVLWVLGQAGWKVNSIRTSALFKDKYCLPSRRWMQKELWPLWKAEALRLGLRMVGEGHKYNCVDLAFETYSWRRRRDAKNAKVPFPVLWGLNLFTHRESRSEHAVIWTIVNDGGPEPKDYQLSLINGFDPQMGLYELNKDETASIYTWLA